MREALIALCAFVLGWQASRSWLIAGLAECMRKGRLVIVSRESKEAQS